MLLSVVCYWSFLLLVVCSCLLVFDGVWGCCVFCCLIVVVELRCRWSLLLFSVVVRRLVFVDDVVCCLLFDE